MRVVIVHAPLKGAYISRHLFFAFFASKNPDAAEADPGSKSKEIE